MKSIAIIRSPWFGGREATFIELDRPGAVHFGSIDGRYYSLTPPYEIERRGESADAPPFGPVSTHKTIIPTLLAEQRRRRAVAEQDAPPKG